MLELITGASLLLILIYSCLALAVPLSEWLMEAQGPLARILATFTLAGVWLTLVFHLLLNLHVFNRPFAALVLLAGVVALRLSGRTHGELRAAIRRDLRWIGRTGLGGRWPALRWVYAVAGLFVALTAARALVLPTVGWDTITYHFVKAGMWVQSGGPIEMQAPGGWHAQRGFFAGGEIFSAWAMLPFGNDMLACAVDLLWWGLIALALHAIAAEFGLRIRHRSAAVLYACFLPAVWDAVGRGYVDLANTAFSLVGLTFALLYARTRRPEALLLSTLALAMAAGIKLTSVCLFGVLGIALLVGVLRDRSDAQRQIGHLLVGCGLSALIVGPWLLHSFLESGYPLSLPITLGGLQLGADDPASNWFGQRPFSAYTWQSEWHALRVLFPWPSAPGSHLSALSCLPIVLTPLGFVRLFRDSPDRRFALVLVLLFMLVTLGFFYSPLFSLIRIEFVWTNGRFLVPVVVVCLLMAFAALPRGGPWRDTLSGYLLIATLVHFCAYAPLRLTSPSITWVAIATAGVVAGSALIAWLARSGNRWRVPALALLFALALFALASLRTPETRFALLANRIVPAEWFRYWWVAARYIDEVPGPQRIALTSGAWQDADNWLMYYFMGTDLQNTLHYVPISESGEIIPFGPDTRRADGASVEAWLARLREARIDYVMSFVPSSPELSWMRTRPEQFERITGHEDQWALYRVRSPRAR